MEWCQVKNTQTCVPSKRTRGKAEMEERILETTDRLFYGQGIRAIGVDTIAAETGISKRTLYNYFTSKNALIAAYLSRRIRPIAGSDAPPAEQILGVFERLEHTFASRGFRGCPFVNAVAELGEHPARAIAANFKEGRRVWFRDRLIDLGIRDAEGLATQLSLLVDGAIAAALVRNDAAMAAAAREAARTLLRSAGVRFASTGKTGKRRSTRRGPAPAPKR